MNCNNEVSNKCDPTDVLDQREMYKLQSNKITNTTTLCRIQITLIETQQVLSIERALYRVEQRMSISGQYVVRGGPVSGAGVGVGVGADVVGVDHPGGGRGHLQQAGHAGGLARPLPPPHQELEGEGGNDEAKQGSEHDVLRVVFVV